MLRIVTIFLLIAFLFFPGFDYLELFGQQLDNHSKNAIIKTSDQNFNLTTSDIEEIKEIAKNISMQTARIIQILEDSGEKSIAGVFVGTIAFLVGLSLVLFGLRMSQKLPPLLSKYYLILMLALVLPVTFILVEFLIGNIFDVWIGYGDAVEDPFVVIAILYMIPVAALLSLIYVHEKFRDKK